MPLEMQIEGECGFARYVINGLKFNRPQVTRAYFPFTFEKFRSSAWIQFKLDKDIPLRHIFPRLEHSPHHGFPHSSNEKIRSKEGIGAISFFHLPLRS